MDGGWERKEGKLPSSKAKTFCFCFFFLGLIYIPREKEEVIKYIDLCKGNKPVSSKPWQSEKNC